MGNYRCLTCDNTGLLCENCVVKAHRHLPLHRIQVRSHASRSCRCSLRDVLQWWNGRHFTQTPLKDLGLRLQLGHPPGEVCPLPHQAWGDDFVIVDVDAVHTLGVDYCHCGATSKSEVDQLLERRLYPATVENPKTAATFRVLEVFEIMQYESKVSPFELWKAISRLTDNTGLRTVRVRAFFSPVQYTFGN